MIEMTYKGNGKNKNAEDKQRIPKNIRQIGEVDRERKVYLEDYAVTYLQQVKSAVLLGEVMQTGGTRYIFVNGAIEITEMEFSNSVWENLYREVKEHFGDREIVGFYRKTEETQDSEEGAEELFRQNFPEDNKVLVVSNTLENEEAIFMMENGMLRQQQGYYIYYEKNELMQEYMILKNEGHSVEQEEVVADKAIKSFRKILGGKKEQVQADLMQGQKMEAAPETRKEMGPDPIKESKPKHEPKAHIQKAAQKPSRFAYAAGTFLVLLVAAIGLTMVNNNEKMKNMETALANMTRTTEEAQNVVNQGGISVKDDKQTEMKDLETGDPGKDDTAKETETNMQDKDAAQTTETDTQDSDAAQTAETGKQNTEDTEANHASGQDVPNPNASKTPGSGGIDSKQTDQGSAKSANAGAAGQASYTVKTGDTLVDICKMYYGNADKLEEVCRMNGIEDPNKILLGQKILLP